MAKEKKTDYTIETQQNLMRAVEYLATDITKPTTVGELKDALGITYNQALWTLNNLVMRDWAEQIGDGWRLSPRIVRISSGVSATLAELVKKYLG